LIVKCAAVNSGPDGYGCHNLAALGVEHRHEFVVASAKEAVVSSIERNPSGFFPGLQCPTRNHFVLGGVHNRDLAFVFEIAVNAPSCSIRYGKLRAPVERNCGHDTRILRINYCG
jgi:hypothetical protein